MLGPRSLAHASKTSRSAVLHWSIPPKIGRNGIILQYALRLYIIESTPRGRKVESVRNFTVTIDNPTIDEPTTLMYTLTTLTPHTYYNWRVAAVNEAGMGPFNASNSFWTLQDGECVVLQYKLTKWILTACIVSFTCAVPGPVSNLSYSITSNTSANITWSEPTEPNGFITGYVMEYGVYEANKTKVNFRKDVTATSLEDLGELLVSWIMSYYALVSLYIRGIRPMHSSIMFICMLTECSICLMQPESQAHVRAFPEFIYPIYKQG